MVGEEHARRATRRCPAFSSSTGRPATAPRVRLDASSRPSRRRAAPSTWAASLGPWNRSSSRAARREPVERTPVWFMRQAGRSLPEYRAIRERHCFWEVAGTPELCAEVTLQPVRRHGVDAAVMFADIMTPVVGMGLDVELVEGVGPVVATPVRTLPTSSACGSPNPTRRSRPCSRRSGSSGASCTPSRPSSASAAGPSPSPGTSSRASRRATSRPSRR